MIRDKKYSFSFTATSLRTKELIQIAQWENWSDTKDLELQIGNGKIATGRRQLTELKKRLEVLSEEQVEILKSGSFKAQNEIAFLAVCKCYDYIREFVVEVIREKYLMFDYTLTEGDYLSFFRRKSYEFEELDNLTENTQAKIRQVTFKMLEQAGIIDDIRHRNILPQLLDQQVIRTIIKDNSEYLKFFLFNDMEIKNLIKVYG